MKKTIYNHIIIFFLFALIAGCDKYVISDDQQLSFIKYYGLNVENEGVDMEKTEDGYIVIGNSGSISNNRDIVVFTTDTYGNLTGEINIIGSSNDDEALKIVPVEDGNFLICARTRTPQDLNNWDQYLIKINASGSVVWEDQYDFVSAETSDFSSGENDNSALDAVYFNKSDVYVIVGYITDNEGIRHSWNGKWDRSGNIVGKPRVSNPNEEITGVYVQNDQIRIVGHTFRNETYNIFQAGLHESGQLYDLNYYRSQDNTSENFDEYAVDIIGDNDNRLLLGYYQDNGLSVPFLVNYVRRPGSSNVNDNFEKNWELFIREDNIEDVKSLSMQNNEIFILANTPESASGYKMKIFRTEINAVNYALFSFGEEGVRLRGNTIMHLDNGVGLIGNSLIGDNSSIIFMKLRPDLTLTPE
ncbi:MAG: hypothetical protein GVY19_08065 [Bacteroidetes bacterium]|jgi:hypothetical protein|nr:hypothetical protein [Bacteroidota bacterium]